MLYDENKINRQFDLYEIKDGEQLYEVKEKNMITNTTGGNAMNSTNFVSFFNTGTTTTSSSWWMPQKEKKIVSVELKDNTVEVVYRQESLYTYTTGSISIGSASNNSYVNERVWKEIYGLKNGIMILLETINGKIVPAQYIPESIVFDPKE